MSENESFERLSQTLADAWHGIMFHLNTRINMRLMHRNKAMSFRSNFRLILPHVNGVIVVGRLPAPADYSSVYCKKMYIEMYIEISWSRAVTVLVTLESHINVCFRMKNKS